MATHQQVPQLVRQHWHRQILIMSRRLFPVKRLTLLPLLPESRARTRIMTICVSALLLIRSTYSALSLSAEGLM